MRELSLLIGVLSAILAVILAGAHFFIQNRLAKHRHPKVSFRYKGANGSLTLFKNVEPSNPALQSAIRSLQSEHLSRGYFIPGWEYIWEIDIGGSPTQVEIYEESPFTTIDDPFVCDSVTTSEALRGPVEMADHAKIPFSKNAEKNFQKLYGVIDALSNGTVGICDAFGAITKAALSNGITYFEVNNDIEQPYQDYFIAEYSGYLDALNARDDRTKLYDALSYGGRFRVHFKEHKIDLTAFTEGLTDRDVCAILALVTLSAISASFKKK